MTYQGLTHYTYDVSLVLDHQKSLLSEKRYQHVLRVRDTAFQIAESLQWEHQQMMRLEQAVLFHDYAKGMRSDELFEYAVLHHIELGESAPPIYHAIVGAWMAEHFFAIDDKEILDAIYYHTTGHKSFCQNPIGAVLFLADYLEPQRKGDRNHIWDEIPHNIVEALYLIVRDKLISVIQRDRVISMESIEFYHFLLDQKKQVI